MWSHEPYAVQNADALTEFHKKMFKFADGLLKVRFRQNQNIILLRILGSHRCHQNRTQNYRKMHFHTQSFFKFPLNDTPLNMHDAVNVTI